MIKAIVTVFDDETGKKYAEDELIEPAHESMHAEGPFVVKVYEFRHSLSIMTAPDKEDEK